MNSKKLLKIVKNKYFITIVIVVGWMTFIDTNGFISQYRLRAELLELRKRKVYLLEEIEKNKAEIDRLSNNYDYQERLAREKYLMKRENEEIFIFEVVK